MDPKWGPRGVQNRLKMEFKISFKKVLKKDALGRVGPEKFPPKLPPGEG